MAAAKVWEVEERNVDEDDCAHWVVARDRDEAIKLVREWIDDRDSDTALVATEVDDNVQLKFNFDGIVISHTAKEWIAIYGHQPTHIVSSEY